MGKRMKHYVKYYNEICEKELSEDARAKYRAELLVQIGFFQHERLIHLIVTVLFAILAVGSLYGNLFLSEPLLYVLTVLFLILLVPYIGHYYLLENGVQALYKCYDKLV